MTDLSDVLAACEKQLDLLDEADALGVLGLLMVRAIRRRPPGQRQATAEALLDSLEREIQE